MHYKNGRRVELRHEVVHRSGRRLRSGVVVNLIEGADSCNVVVAIAALRTEHRWEDGKPVPVFSYPALEQYTFTASELEHADDVEAEIAAAIARAQREADEKREELVGEVLDLTAEPEDSSFDPGELGS